MCEGHGGRCPWVSCQRQDVLLPPPLQQQLQQQADRVARGVAWVHCPRVRFFEAEAAPPGLAAAIESLIKFTRLGQGRGHPTVPLPHCAATCKHNPALAPARAPARPVPPPTHPSSSAWCAHTIAPTPAPTRRAHAVVAKADGDSALASLHAHVAARRGVLRGTGPTSLTPCCLSHARRPHRAACCMRRPCIAACAPNGQRHCAKPCPPCMAVPAPTPAWNAGQPPCCPTAAASTLTGPSCSSRPAAPSVKARV